MNIFYRKILTYPKLYSLFIGFICFATFVDLRLWDWALYLNFAIFSCCLLIFLKVYLSLLAKDIERYTLAFAKLHIDTTPSFTHSTTLPRETLQRIVFLTHLFASCWFVVLPAISLLFYNEAFLKILIVFFLVIYVFIAIVRRLAFKFNLSIGRSFLLVTRSLFITAIVSFLPFIALVTAFI